MLINSPWTSHDPELTYSIMGHSGYPTRTAQEQEEFKWH